MLSRIRRRFDDMRAVARLLSEAERHAGDEGIDRPEAEHLVMAALNHPDGRARTLLARHGVDAATFADAVRSIHAASTEQIGVEAPDDAIDAVLPSPGAPRGLYRSAPSAERLMRQVADDADGFDSADIVRMAARFERSTTALALAALGVSADDLLA